MIFMTFQLNNFRLILELFKTNYTDIFLRFKIIWIALIFTPVFFISTIKIFNNCAIILNSFTFIPLNDYRKTTKKQDNDIYHNKSTYDIFNFAIFMRFLSIPI